MADEKIPLNPDSSTDAKNVASKPEFTQTDPGRVALLHTLHIKYNHFSILQKTLVTVIVAISAVMTYALVQSAKSADAATDPNFAKEQVSALESYIKEIKKQQPQISNLPHDNTSQTSTVAAGETNAAEPLQSLSLKVAQDLYLNRDYQKAQRAYSQLLKNLPTKPENQAIAELLELKIALCMEQTADSNQAARLLANASKSKCPLVNVVANYRLGLLELQKNQYLPARTRAYKAIGLIDSANQNLDWAKAIKSSCHFLTSRCLTSNVLLLCDADKDIPDVLWNEPDKNEEVFINLDEEKLRAALDSSTKKLDKAILGPQIKQTKTTGKIERFSISCQKVPIEELLAKFAVHAKLDVSWSGSKNADADKNSNSYVKARPATLYLQDVTAEQFVSIAAGSVGLAAKINDKIITICDPANYNSLSEHISALNNEADWLWQTFLMEFHGDEKAPNAHFALALLHVEKDQPTEAIAEYKLTANRFSQTPLAPLALLNSSKLKINLLDYTGACEDLNQLVEQYTGSEIAERSCLYLASATMKANLYEKAAKLYSKAYNLGLSPRSQMTAALGAGKCFYHQKDYQSADKWLRRSVKLTSNSTDKQLSSIYLLLGKINFAMNKPEQACNAFGYALRGELENEDYIETISQMVKWHIKQQEFVEAVCVLEDVPDERFSQKEFIEILLLKSENFRLMGFVDKAIAILGDKIEYISDEQLEARAAFELTKCYIAKGDLLLAYSRLNEILVTPKPGNDTYEITLELADVCLKLGRNEQSISICSALTDFSLSQPMKEKTAEILITAYNREKKYDQAALVILGELGQTKKTDEKVATNDSLNKEAIIAIQ